VILLWTHHSIEWVKKVETPAPGDIPDVLSGLNHGWFQGNPTWPGMKVIALKRRKCNVVKMHFFTW
jgi:hypothetical protein